jgi:hypothetical protein
MPVTYFPIVVANLARDTNRLRLSWSVDWNGTTNPKTVQVTLAPTAGGASVYTSTAASGSNVAVSGLLGGVSYTLSVFASGFSSLYGEVVETTRTAVAFTSAVTVWNGTDFIPVTATKVWNGSIFVKASAVKSNSVAGSTPVFGTLG